MSNSSESRPDNGRPESPPERHEHERTGHSGEGAASVLAHLKTQGRQHHLGAGADDPAGGTPQ